MNRQAQFMLSMARQVQQISLAETAEANVADPTLE